MIKNLLQTYTNKVHPAIWFLLALFSGSMAALGASIALHLHGAPVMAAIAYFQSGFTDNTALAVAVLGTLMSTTFMFFCFGATITFYKKSIELSSQPSKN